MIRTILIASTFAIIASGAVAQTTPAPATPAMPAAPATPSTTMATSGHLASNLIGEDVYNGTADDAETIGEVSDMVVDRSGMVTQLVVGVGGFLGIGQKNVAIPFKDASWASKDNDRWLVVTTTKEALEALPAFDASIYEPMPPAGSATPPATAPGGTAPVAPRPAN